MRLDLDALLSDCPEPEATLLDDNLLLAYFSFPARLFLGELLERAGMHEQALAQVQPAIVFSPCNPRLKIKAWLLLGRCHAAMGHKVSGQVSELVGRLVGWLIGCGCAPCFSRH